MSKSNATKFKETFSLPNQGLRAYFGNVVKGQPEVYTAPFAKGESTQDMLSKWQVQLESIATEWPTLMEFEMEMKSKVGPLSVMAPLKERIKDIDAYYTGVEKAGEPLSDSAIKAALSEWKMAKGLRLRSQSDTVRNMKKSTNSGSPYFIKRRNALDKTLPVLGISHQGFGGEVLQMLDNGYNVWKAAAVLGWRGQEGGYAKEDVKQRVVWMFPLAVNIEELRVYQPLIEAAQRFNINPAWVSMEAVDARITQLFDSKGSDDLIVCTDFTAFDQHFNSSLQDAAKAMIATLFTANYDTNRWIQEVYPVKYMIPLAYDYNKIRYGKHGMGSGSGGTNADETLAHKCLQYEAAQSVHAVLNPNSMCLGDDGILSYPGINIEDVITSYSKHGLEMNETKQNASKTDCIYLRRWHHQRYRVSGICVGVYSTFRALGRLRYLERFMDPEIWGPKAVALRQLSILENVKYHPLKEKFVDFCMERDKYRLGIDIPHFLTNLEAEVKTVTDYMPDFLGYNRSMQSEHSDGYGINSWWIVKYLKSKA